MPEIQYRKAEKGIDNQRPFLGLRSFEEKNKSQFGGRDKEIKELYGLDENSVLTVVFGKSGIGKTSLIKAGLIPELRQNFYFPIYVRIDYSSPRTPLEQVQKIVFEEMKEKDPGVPEIGSTTLWEYFHNVNLLDDLVTPVLILDQFEEIFTLGGDNKDVLQFLIHLADLAENRIPLTVQGEYQKRNKTVPSHYAEQPYRVILSLREDYLARLEELKKYMPSIMNSRFRVVQMTIGQALEAAIKPGRGLIDGKVALEIIKKLPGISLTDFDPMGQRGSGQKNLKVEPFLLSLVYDRLNEKRLEKSLKKITVDVVSNFNVTDVIYSFYTETITPYGENVEQAIEDCLLTEGGFRKLQALEEFQRLYDISDEVVDQLVDARILRKEIRDGVDYVELIHDVLAPIIKGKRSKRARLAREEERQAEIIRAKKRQRTRLIRVSSIVALALLLISAVAIKFALDNLKTKLHHDKMALARNLMQRSERLGSEAKRLHTARLAYQIYNLTKDTDAGEDIYDIDFYNAMYRALPNSLNFRPYKYEFESNNNVNVASILHVDSTESYLSYFDGTVRTKDNTILVDRSNQGYVINSMELYRNEGKNFLALTGTFDSILLYDLDSDRITKKIAIPNPISGPKWTSFTSTGGLNLPQGNQLLEWENDFVEMNNFSIENVEDFQISKGVRYSGTDSFILGTFTGQVITVGMQEGDDIAIRLAHSTRVSDIDISADQEYIATGAEDGTIVIWNRKTGNSLSLNAGLFWSDIEGKVYQVSFADGGDFVIGVYGDGSVLKWPVSSEVLAQLLSETMEGGLDCAQRRTYLKDNDLGRELGKAIDDLLEKDFNCP